MSEKMVLVSAAKMLHVVYWHVCPNNSCPVKVEMNDAMTGPAHTCPVPVSGECGHPDPIKVWGNRHWSKLWCRLCGSFYHGYWYAPTGLAGREEASCKQCGTELDDLCVRCQRYGAV